MPEWQERRFEEVIDFQEGPGIMAVDFRSSGVPLVRLSGLERGTGSLLDGCNYLDPEMVDRKWSHFRLRVGDTLLSTSASLGRTAIVDERAAGSIPYTGIIRMKPRDPGILQSSFVRFLLESRHFQEQVEAMGVGSVIKHFGPSHLRQMRVWVPLLAHQTAIARMLNALDDKIGLNRRTNETLEAMARTLFKSWFVDFDPVRAMLEGRAPAGTVAEIAAMFPASFDASFAVDMPNGWVAQSLYETASFINGGAFRDADFVDRTEGLPVVKIAELKNGVAEQTRFAIGNQSRVVEIHDGDLLLSWSGNPDTSIGTFIWVGGPALLNQHIFKVVFRSDAERTWGFCLLKEIQPVLMDLARGKQTTGLGHFTVADMKKLLVVRPTDACMTAFHLRAAPLLNSIALHLRESRTLAALRDSLLPKLLSGELRVKDAERIAGTVL